MPGGGARQRAAEPTSWLTPKSGPDQVHGAHLAALDKNCLNASSGIRRTLNGDRLPAFAGNQRA